MPSGKINLDALGVTVSLVCAIHCAILPPKHHRRPAPALLFTAGMILLISKQIWHGREIILLALALPLILGAHAWNYRLNRAFSRIRNRQYN